MDRRPQADNNGGIQPPSTGEQLQSLIDQHADWFLTQSDIEQVAVGQDPAGRPYLHIGTSGDVKEVGQRVFQRLLVRPEVKWVPQGRAYDGSEPE